MTDEQILTLLATAAKRSCTRDSLCSCGRVTRLWQAVESSLYERHLGEEDREFAARVVTGEPVE